MVPASVTVECDQIPDPPVVGVDVKATDNCDNDVHILVTELTIPGECPSSFTIVRTFTAKDACGNWDAATQTVKVEDTTPPVLADLPDDLTLDCTEDCEGVMLDAEKLPKAVYQATYTGGFVLTNDSGVVVETSEGQFHSIADVNGPIEVLPNDPGFRNDPLPFSVPGGGPQRAGGQECVVR